MPDATDTTLLALLNQPGLQPTALADRLRGAGIGPALADAILTRVRTEGPLEELDSLTAIRGLGRGRLAALRALARDGGLAETAGEEAAVEAAEVRRATAPSAPRLQAEAAVPEDEPVDAGAVLGVVLDAMATLDQAAELGFVDATAAAARRDRLGAVLAAVDEAGLLTAAAAQDPEGDGDPALAFRTAQVVVDALVAQLPEQSSFVGLDVRGVAQAVPFALPPGAVLTNSLLPELPPDKAAELAKALADLLDDLYGALTPAQQKAVQGALVRVHNLLIQLRRSASPATITALGTALRGLLARLAAAGVNRRLIAFLLRELIRILSRFGIVAVSGGSGAAAGGSAAAAVAIKALLVVLVALLAHLLAEWAFSQKIPGTNQSYRDYYADKLFRLFNKGLIRCDALQSEVLRRLRFFKRLLRFRPGLRDAQERAENQDAIVGEGGRLIVLIDRTLKACPRLPSAKSLRILRAYVLREAARVAAEAR